MIPTRSEQDLGTGVTFATGHPRLVTRMPSAGSPSNKCRHCSRKSLTLKLFIPRVYRLLYISPKRAQDRLGTFEFPAKNRIDGVGTDIVLGIKETRNGCGTVCYLPAARRRASWEKTASGRWMFWT